MAGSRTPTRRPRAADEFEHPYIAVDLVLLTLTAARLHVVLLHRPRESEGVAGWGLPGAYLAISEEVADAQGRILRDKVGVALRPDFGPLRPRDALDRDPRRRTISLPFWAPVAVGAVGDRAEQTTLAPVALDGGDAVIEVDGERVGLAIDHADIVTEAVRALAADVDHLRPADGAIPHLLAERFTYRDVEDAINAVRDRADDSPPPDVNALRRRLGPLTEPTGELEELQPGQRHRPAELRRWSRSGGR